MFQVLDLVLAFCSNLQHVLVTVPVIFELPLAKSEKKVRTSNKLEFIYLVRKYIDTHAGGRERERERHD